MKILMGLKITLFIEDFVKLLNHLILKVDIPTTYFIFIYPIQKTKSHMKYSFTLCLFYEKINFMSIHQMSKFAISKSFNFFKNLMSNDEKNYRYHF